MGTLQQGSKAPAFDLVDQDGNRVALGDYRGRMLLVFFYPRAATPG